MTVSGCFPNSPPPTTLAIGDTAEEANASRLENNEPGRAALLERYMGQIDARIQRARVRPRTPVDFGLFECRVRIAQEPNGRVREIEIARCNGDIPWQTSLVRAIQSASPLPAPPDPKVFSQTLTFEFTARQFVPGGDLEGFEPSIQITPH
jgi:TonB family protein